MDCAKRSSRSTVFRIVPKFKKEKVPKQKTTSPQPGRWPTLDRGTVRENASLGRRRQGDENDPALDRGARHAALESPKCRRKAVRMMGVRNGHFAVVKMMPHLKRVHVSVRSCGLNRRTRWSLTCSCCVWWVLVRPFRWVFILLDISSGHQRVTCFSSS